MIRILNTIWIFAVLAGCSQRLDYAPDADAQGHVAPTGVVSRALSMSAQRLPFSDQQDFEDARRGLIASMATMQIAASDGSLVWDMESYRFVDEQTAASGKAPASVHPSLYRQSALNNIHGLFKVVDGVYQLRGFDLANMTLIEGQQGWIVVDPLTSAETARAAMAFANEHLGARPISAIIFTHSHIDHFGGVLGLTDTLSDAERTRLRIIAPQGFMEEATSENLIAGTAMGRRSMFMYGKQLARSERGHVGSGLGKGPAYGSFGILEPNELIADTPVERIIDGVKFIFQYTPESEAPAEMTFYLPEKKAFCGAELVSRNLHNLYTLRGAKVRDALNWSGLIEEARVLFADAEVYFGSHHWPLWGREQVQHFLAQQRDVYKFIHDQSVRLMNQGYTPSEIAEVIKLPDALAQYFPNRGYYGTVKHNARAVYQAYMGWFTGNPAQLDPLPEQESAQRTIALMGGATQVLAHAQAEYQRLSEKEGEPDSAHRDYRWLAQLLNQLVFAEPDMSDAKALLAQVYDQLGYLSESAPWRDFYLTAAFELRHGAPEEGLKPALMKQVFLRTPVAKFFESMAVNLNAEKAEGESTELIVHFTDLDERYLLQLHNSVLHHRPVGADDKTDLTLHITRALFIDVMVGEAGLRETVLGDALSVEGSALKLLGFLSLFDKPQGNFAIVTP